MAQLSSASCRFGALSSNKSEVKFSTNAVKNAVELIWYTSVGTCWKTVLAVMHCPAGFIKSSKRPIYLDQRVISMFEALIP